MVNHNNNKKIIFTKIVSGNTELSATNTYMTRWNKWAKFEKVVNSKKGEQI